MLVFRVEQTKSKNTKFNERRRMIKYLSGIFDKLIFYLWLTKVIFVEFEILIAGWLKGGQKINGSKTIL